MTRIRIIIPAAMIERAKLYLVRAGALLLCVLIFPLAAHASPFDSGISSIQTLFTGTVAKAASLIAIVIGGYEWKRETGEIESYKHDQTGRWLYIAPQANFYGREAQPISRENALEHAAHRPSHAVADSLNVQPSSSDQGNDQGIGL